MRWLFADPHQAEEAAHVRHGVAAIDRWWQSFQSKATDLDALFSRHGEWDLPQFMEDTLQAIDPRLMWEFGPALHGPGHRLVITPESDRWLRPMVRTILDRAPKISGWEFYPYRPAETADETVQTVRGRVGVDISGAAIEASAAPGRKVDLRFAFPGASELDDETALRAAFVATETLLGEQVLDNWIGEISLLEGHPRSATRLLPLERAQATVAALIRSCIEQLPPVRRHELPGDDRWTTVELEAPEPADDYPGRSDFFVGQTRDLELLRAIHSGQPFASSCHSRLGETFCYLKLDGQDVSRERFVAFRSAFEDALQSALASAGAVVGGGSGLRYAYIDLALSDLKHAAPLIRQVLAQGRAPLRSWLLFNDDDYAREWVGAYSDTPPPPAALPDDAH